MREKLVKNAAGRMVPDEINGQPVIPFKGVGNISRLATGMHPASPPI